MTEGEAKEGLFFEGLLFEIDLKRFRVGKVLGSGAFGVVISAEDRFLNISVAIKQIPRTFDISENSRKIIRELLILDVLRHPNIVSLIDVEIIKENLYIITERAQYVLQNYAKTDKFQRISLHEQVSLMHQLIDALNFIHNAKVIHRDIKPSNILVDENFRIKLIDFGSARYFDPNIHLQKQSDKLTEYVVTRWYRAPEVILNPGRYGYEQDVWSAGCVFAFMLRGDALFPGINSPDQIKAIIKVLGPPSEEDLDFDISPLCRRYVENVEIIHRKYLENELRKAPANLLDLIRLMLQFNPKKRINSCDCLFHSAFSEYLKKMNTTSNDKISTSTHSDPGHYPEKHFNGNISSSSSCSYPSQAVISDELIKLLSEVSVISDEEGELNDLIYREIEHLKRKLHKRFQHIAVPLNANIVPENSGSYPVNLPPKATPPTRSPSHMKAGSFHSFAGSVRPLASQLTTASLSSLQQLQIFQSSKSGTCPGTIPYLLSKVIIFNI